MFAYVFKTIADPFAGRINLFRVYSGHGHRRLARSSTRAPTQGAHRPAARAAAARRHATPTSSAPGDIGAVAKLKETPRRRRAGRPATEPISLPPIDAPGAGDGFAIEPKAKGDEEKVATALRRLPEEDPTLDLRRDPQTGEQILAGLTQIHVEVSSTG